MLVSLPTTAHFVGILMASLCFLFPARGAISERDRSMPHTASSVQAAALLTKRGVKRPSSARTVSTAGSSKISTVHTPSTIEIMINAIKVRKHAGPRTDDYQYRCCLGMARILAGSEPADMLNHYVSLFINGRTQRPASADAVLLPIATVLLLVHGKGDILVSQLGHQAFTVLDPHNVRQFIMLAVQHQRAAAIVTWLPRILAGTGIDAAEVYSSVATSIQSVIEADAIIQTIWIAAGRQAQVSSSNADAAYRYLVQLTAAISAVHELHTQCHGSMEDISYSIPVAGATGSWQDILCNEIDYLYTSLAHSCPLLSNHVTEPFYLFPTQITCIYMLQLIPLGQLAAVADYMLCRKYAPLAEQATQSMTYMLIAVTALIVNRWLERSAPHSAVFGKLLRLFRHQAHIDLLYFIARHVGDVRRVDAVWQQELPRYYKMFYYSGFRIQTTWHDLNAAILQRIAAQRFKATSCPSMLWICTAPYLAMVQQRLIEVNCAADAARGDTPPGDEEVVNCDGVVNEKIAAVWLLELQHLHALYIQEANSTARLRHPILAPSSARIGNGRGNYELSLIPRLFALSNVMVVRRTSKHIAAHLATHPRVWTVLPCIWYAINSMQAFSIALPAPCSPQNPFCSMLLGDDPERYCRARALRSLSNSIISIPEVAADMHDTDDPVIAAIGHAELVPLLQSRPHALQFVYYLCFFLQWPCPARLSTSVGWPQLYRNLTRALACLADEYSSACGPCRAVQKWLNVRFAPYGTLSKPDAQFDEWIPKLCNLPSLSFAKFLALSPAKVTEKNMRSAQKSSAERERASSPAVSKPRTATVHLNELLPSLADRLASSLPVLSPVLLQDSLAETQARPSADALRSLSVSPDPPQDASIFEFPNLGALNDENELISSVCGHI